MNEYNQEKGEYLRETFEKEYGKTKGSSYGQYLDMTRLPSGDYRSMVTFYAWSAFRQGSGCYNPNENKEN